MQFLIANYKWLELNVKIMKVLNWIKANKVGDYRPLHKLEDVAQAWVSQAQDVSWSMWSRMLIEEELAWAALAPLNHNEQIKHVGNS